MHRCCKIPLHMCIFLLKKKLLHEKADLIISKQLADVGGGVAYLLHLKAMVSEGLIKAWARCIELRLCLMLRKTPG